METTPKGFNIKAQSCANALPWGSMKIKHQPRRGCTLFCRQQNAGMCNPSGVVPFFTRPPRVTRIRATLGFDVEPLRGFVLWQIKTTPKGLPLIAQGYASAASLPWVTPSIKTQPQRGCLITMRGQSRGNPVGVVISFSNPPRVARIRATLGYERKPLWGLSKGFLWN